MLDDQNTEKEADSPDNDLKDTSSESSKPEHITSDSDSETKSEESIKLSPIHHENPTPKTKKHRLRPEIIFIAPLRRKLGRFARPLAVVIILVVVLGAGGLTYWKITANKTSGSAAVKSSFKLKVAAFKLVSTVPSDKATNVNTSTTLVLNFNQPITAAKLINNMFITPKVTGTYKQGSNADQVVFTPSTPFAQGTKVAVMVNGTYESNRGSQLGSPYEYDFTTSIPSNGIEFQDQNGLFDEVTSLPTGQKEAYTLLLGSNISSGASVTLYKGDTSDMLSSLVYGNSNGYGIFNNLSVSTSDLEKVSSVANVTNNQTYNVTEPDGLYVAVATDSSGTEVGMVWIDFSNFGVLMRQDDQKIVYDAQSFSSSQDVSSNVSFYNLNSSVNLLTQKSISGLTSTSFSYSPSVDIAVATDGNETAIVPINLPDSGGDIRVDQDLSTAQQVYGITDKPTYLIGDTVHYAGFVRNDNDAQYTNPGTGTVSLYVASGKCGTPYATFSGSIDANGMFSGTFVPTTSWLNSGDNFDQFQIFASAVDGNCINDIPIASFSVSSQANPSSSLTVKFSKASYLPSDPITATITGTNSSGQPLVNTAVEVHIFSEDYYENDPAANLENFGYTGNELPDYDSPVKVTLNSQGQAVFTVNPANLPDDGSSQLVTLEADLPGQTGAGAAGGDSAVIHQGDAEIAFGPNRTGIPTGDDLISDVYVNHLNGNAMGSATVNYVLQDSTNSSTLASGNVQTDSSGFAEVDIPAASLASNGDGMQLVVSTVDQYGNNVKAETYYGVEQPGVDYYDTSGAALEDLNITGSSSDVIVGQTVNLTINAPANIRALVTFDRGRIYNQAMLNLAKGNNIYSFTVGSDLAPSFTLTFNYFLDGVYHSEGASFNVSDPSQSATVNLTPASQAVSANKSTTVQVNTADSSGNPLATSMIVDVVSTNAYDLTSAVNPDIFDTLYQSRPIMTSSTSSLSPVGSGGGRCGGGGGDLPSFANAIGTTLYWQPELNTDSNGQASFSFTPTSGSWIINVYAMSGATQVGEAQTTITAQ